VIRHRLNRLRPWLVRALIPPERVGSYILYRAAVPVYMGRSGSDLRRRLLQHAGVGTTEYFGYDVHPSPWHAFQVECSLYHAGTGQLTNRVHPRAPTSVATACPFCGIQLCQVLDNRLAPSQ
jgi:hypothetical protein